MYVSIFEQEKGASIFIQTSFKIYITKSYFHVDFETCRISFILSDHRHFYRALILRTDRTNVCAEKLMAIRLPFWNQT